MHHFIYHDVKLYPYFNILKHSYKVYPQAATSPLKELSAASTWTCCRIFFSILKFFCEKEALKALHSPSYYFSSAFSFFLFRFPFRFNFLFCMNRSCKILSFLKKPKNRFTFPYCTITLAFFAPLPMIDDRLLFFSIGLNALSARKKVCIVRRPMANRFSPPLGSDKKICVRPHSRQFCFSLQHLIYVVAFLKVSSLLYLTSVIDNCILHSGQQRREEVCENMIMFGF